MRRTKKLVASLFASGLLAAGIAAPTVGAQPVVTGGLINVTLVDVADIEDNTVNVGVGVAANIAANLCDTADVNAAVLAAQVVRGGDTVDCAARGGTITFEQVQRG